MAKIIVEIEVPFDQTHIEEFSEHWFPTGDKRKIGIDRVFLDKDPTDDSFFLLTLVEIKP